MSDSQSDDAPDGLTKEQLWKRVRRLEKHAFPDRRELLKAGGALGAAGLMGGAGYGAGKAEAGTQSAGDVGTANNPSDAYLEDVYPPGGPGSGNSTNITSIKTVNSIREVQSGDNLQTVIDDEGGDSYIRVHPGTYTADSFDVPYDNVTIELLKNATLKLVNGAANNQVLKPDGNGFTLCGEGVIDPNPANNSSPNHGIRSFPTSHITDVEIRGVTVNDPLGTGIVIGKAGGNIRIENVRVGDGSQNMRVAIDVTAQSGTYEGVNVTDCLVGPFHATDASDSVVIETDSGTVGDTADETVCSGIVVLAPFATKQSSTGQYYAFNFQNGTRSIAVSDCVARADDSDGSGGGLLLRAGNNDDAQDGSVTGCLFRGPGQSNHARGLLVNAMEHVAVTGCVTRNFDTTNQYNLGTTGLATGNNVVVVGNAADGSTSFDADTAVTANNN